MDVRIDSRCLRCRKTVEHVDVHRAGVQRLDRAQLLEHGLGGLDLVEEQVAQGNVLEHILAAWERTLEREEQMQGLCELSRTSTTTCVSELASKPERERERERERETDVLACDCLARQA